MSSTVMALGWLAVVLFCCGHSLRTSPRSGLVSQTRLFGSMADIGALGLQGEYYFVAGKKPTLKAPAEALGKERLIALFPRNQVLSPLGEEYLGVYEMRYRQLLQDLGPEGTFGHIYYSQENSKLALVGTMAKIRKKETLDDGGVYVLMEGCGRFYIKEILKEKPYLLARVQPFVDHTNEKDDVLLDELELKVLQETRLSVKIMKLLYPQNHYAMNNAVIRHRPPLPVDGVRQVLLPGSDPELMRRSKFSFATMDMLKTDPITKLLFLQEHVLEKRLKLMIKVLGESASFLEGELRKRAMVTGQSLEKMKDDMLADTSDIIPAPKQQDVVWPPDNPSQQQVPIELM